jgi:hypothetical protein
VQNWTRWLEQVMLYRLQRALSSAHCPGHPSSPAWLMSYLPVAWGLTLLRSSKAGANLPELTLACSFVLFLFPTGGGEIEGFYQLERICVRFPALF